MEALWSQNKTCNLITCRLNGPCPVPVVGSQTGKCGRSTLSSHVPRLSAGQLPCCSHQVKNYLGNYSTFPKSCYKNDLICIFHKLCDISSFLPSFLSTFLLAHNNTFSWHHGRPQYVCVVWGSNQGKDMHSESSLWYFEICNAVLLTRVTLLCNRAYFSCLIGTLCLLTNLPAAQPLVTTTQFPVSVRLLLHPLHLQTWELRWLEISYRVKAKLH